MARLLYRWALRACPPGQRGLRVLRCDAKRNTGAATDVDLIEYKTHSEMRQWMPMFGNVNVIVLVIAADHDNPADFYEGGGNNCWACEMVDLVLDFRCFAQLPVLVMLHREEAFRAKAEAGLIAKHFPQYRGGTDVAKGHEFLTNYYLGRNKDAQRCVYSHFSADASDGRCEL